MYGAFHSSSREAWTWQGEGLEDLNHFFLDLQLGHIWVKSEARDISNHCVLGVGCREQVRVASGPLDTWTVAFCVPVFASLSLAFFLSLSHKKADQHGGSRMGCDIVEHLELAFPLDRGGASLFLIPLPKAKMLWPSIKGFCSSIGSEEISTLESGFTLI